MSIRNPSGPVRVGRREALVGLRRSGTPGTIGSTGWDRSRAWIRDFSSMHSTRAFSGGSRQGPTTSRTLSMSNGSVDSRDVCERCGARANARQIREIADCDMPVAAAIDLVDQWVAFFGFSSGVLTMTRSTSASVIFRGAPGRGSSDRPSRPRSTKRRRQVRAVSRRDAQPPGHLHDRVPFGVLQHDP
ncbi:hypothetical protein SHIRM173S_09912 [Streptomyces hirsutus]